MAFLDEERIAVVYRQTQTAATSCEPSKIFIAVMPGGLLIAKRSLARAFLGTGSFADISFQPFAADVASREAFLTFAVGKAHEGDAQVRSLPHSLPNLMTTRLVSNSTFLYPTPEEVTRL